MLFVLIDRVIGWWFCATQKNNHPFLKKSKINELMSISIAPQSPTSRFSAHEKENESSSRKTACLLKSQTTRRSSGLSPQPQRRQINASASAINVNNNPVQFEWKNGEIEYRAIFAINSNDSYESSTLTKHFCSSLFANFNDNNNCR
jgi:hypothetical protein